jgi:hypothetical protein
LLTWRRNIFFDNLPGTSVGVGRRAKPLQEIWRSAHPHAAVIQAGRKSLSANGTLDPLKVDAPHFCRRNQTSAFPTYRIERCPHLSRFWWTFSILRLGQFFLKRGVFNGHAWLRKLFQTPLPTWLSVEDYFQFTHFIYASIDGD